MDKKQYQALYYEKNKEKILQKSRTYWESNKEKVKVRMQKYETLNKEKTKAYRKQYNQENVEKRKQYWIDNKEQLTKKHLNRVNIRYHSDPKFKLTAVIRALTQYAFKSKGFKKNSKTENLLGCSFEEFKNYIESKFEPWMNWNNHGLFTGSENDGWDIDHIIPISSAATEEEILRLSHYTNLQPLCSYTNRFVKKNNIL